MQNEGEIHMNSEKTKKCKYCKSEIPADARICPQCRKKVKGGKLKWIFLLLSAAITLLFAFLAAVPAARSAAP